MDLRKEEILTTYRHKRDVVILDLAKMVRSRKRMSNQQIGIEIVDNMDSMIDNIIGDTANKLRAAHERIEKLDAEAATTEAQKKQTTIPGTKESNAENH